MIHLHYQSIKKVIPGEKVLIHKMIVTSKE